MFHKRLLKEFKENKKYVAAMVFTQWGLLLANMWLVWTLAKSLEGILNGTQVPLVPLFVTLFAVMAVRGLLNRFNIRMSFLSSSHVKRRMRDLVYAKLMNLGSSYRDHITTAEAVQVSTEGVEQLEIYFGKYIPQFFYSLLAPVTLFVVVSGMSLKVAVVLLLCVPLIPVSIVAVQKFAKKLLSKYWGSYTGLGDTFLESLRGLTTLKIYEADERYAKKMDEEAEQFRRITMRVLIMQLNSISIMDLVAYGGAALGIILNILEYRAGNLVLAESFFILLVSAEFFLPLRLLGSFFHIAMNGNAAADKIFTLLDVNVPEDGTLEEIPSCEVSFDQVTFGYDKEKEVLSHVSFQVPEHSFTAIVGASGCGKSTVASLIMGEHRPVQGKVTLGECPVQSIQKSVLLKKVTRIRHNSYLFQGTVAENLYMGKENATFEELREALKSVDLLDTIMEKGGLDMMLTEQAANLSGGQKQRLALARAILHDSDIYIFDEATSNIDAESENSIMKVIYRLAREKTVILISHRLANVIKADQILVMEKGRITESGTHDQLMAGCGLYEKLYLRQRELEKYAEEEAEICLG